ncbi:hypothetical protein BBP40_002954 [Aspergillus hancockii]|nr:hypothetical protein BBP40_002954 [Aspergillus hancockii]
MTDKNGPMSCEAQQSPPAMDKEPDNEAPVISKRPEWVVQKMARLARSNHWWRRHDFLIHFKFNKLKVPLYARDIECLNKWGSECSDADIFRDKALYERGEREDYDLFEKLYRVRLGCRWDDIHICGREERKRAFEAYARSVASTRRRCTARFHELFAEFVAARKAAGPHKCWCGDIPWTESDLDSNDWCEEGRSAFDKLKKVHRAFFHEACWSEVSNISE